MQLTPLLLLASASAIAADAALRGAATGSGASEVETPVHGNEEAGSLIRGWRNLEDNDDKEAGSLIRGWRNLEDNDDKEAGSLIRASYVTPPLLGLPPGAIVAQLHSLVVQAQVGWAVYYGILGTCDAMPGDVLVPASSRL
ncbi:hypothetical protein SPRG_08939 [Saprolegnia parasitica CBS 223.65]|uniref:Uncharacterized protein n=1 Tax=Saprolegnia parasitica (strain CBS 223.65) TaxID=695850 RepID=A0A067C908_SAPPC|nr:hypothetical protein SPRG_08939 [Saprolegnia parasitica CBS 223.65]KDO25640.1 hypothetical protein SPRG_08939 [Saprolegnia parasitica CBS 223.65]|eukprot:XP_012203672.1 hypothetical protein SPRG_08939 [Saprolegnia parasitica CBS 223.65]